MPIGKTKIDWCDYTWNPVVGCKHDCPYCYARKLNHRFKWIKNWTEPQIFPERFDDFSPYMRIKKGSKIFVGSMCDLFGDWIPDKWINEVIKTARVYAGFTFMFLTKNSKRYLDFEFPPNCQLGITIDIVNQARLNYLKQTSNYKFVSFEPLLGDMSMLNLSGIDLVIVGAMTGAGAIKPKKEWIDSIQHPNIFYKNNIKKYL